ncbi:MAG: mechanosensitive ion channel family protein [Clostridia bacterium]|nr:mechanosensitive ion channel family protein [Clostridia bacterium]
MPTVLALSQAWLDVDAWAAALLRALEALGVALAIVLAGHLAARIVSRLIDRSVALRIGDDASATAASRATTVRGLLKSAARYTIDALVVITVLNAWGVPMGGLLAGAGVAGLAIGFGAQNLVRDVITGFFLLFEDQFRVGDHVEAAGVSGEVVDIGFRVTRIRDWGGQIHTIPNSRFDSMTNYSRGPMRVQVRVKVAYDEDAGRVEGLLREVCDRFAQESPDMVEGPMVLGMSGLDETGMEFLLWGRAQGGQQWAAERALRMAVKTALDAAGVRGPIPQVVVRRREGGEAAGGPGPA